QQGQLHLGIEHRALGVRMRVDESGHHQASLSLEDLRVRAVVGIEATSIAAGESADGGDPLALDEHVGLAHTIGGDHAAAADQHCIHEVLLVVIESSHQLLVICVTSPRYNRCYVAGHR